MDDVIIAGLGGMGSAVAAHAAARGLRVVGLERFHPVHAYGASHGRTRLIRQAYFEGSNYVPLLLRAYELWDALEVRTEIPLRGRTGALYVGPADSALISGALASAKMYGLAVDSYDRTDVTLRYPMFTLNADDIGVFENAAGVVFPEPAVRAHQQAAIADGAELRFGVFLRDWQSRGDGVRVSTEAGTTIAARHLVLCMGPWFQAAAASVGIPIRVERNVQFWFEPSDGGLFAPDRFPAFAVDRPGQKFFYGFPDYGDGVKFAFHHSGDYTSPDALDRVVSAPEITRAREALTAFLPDAAGVCLDAAACMYALTPDEHFVIGPHPDYANVILAGGFSGHGFKFCPVIGEIVANLLAGADPGPVDMFSPKRFTSQLTKETR